MSLILIIVIFALAFFVPWGAYLVAVNNYNYRCTQFSDMRPLDKRAKLSCWTAMHSYMLLVWLAVVLIALACGATLKDLKPIGFAAMLNCFLGLGVNGLIAGFSSDPLEWYYEE